MSFGLADYLVFGAMLAVSSCIGLYYSLTGGRQATSDEYLLGDRTMSVLPVAFSLMASFMSAITLMGVSQENYAFGTQFVMINLAYIVGTPAAAHLYLPVYFRMRASSASASVYSYLERRFGRPTRLVASLAFSLQMVLYMGIVVYAPAMALSAVTGLSYAGSILAVGLACTFYSTLGGIKAVLITDVFQSLLMFAAVFAVIGCGTSSMGGLGEVWRRAEQGGRVQFFNLDLDPTERHTFWTQLIGGLFIYCSIYACNQAQIQRLLTIGDLRRSQLALWIQWPILACLSLSTSLAGLTIYAYYQDCDPVKQGRIGKGDQLLPIFVVDTMSEVPGLSGLLVAGIFSGSLSTVSSAINSLAAVTLEDYIKPFCQVKHPTCLLKILVLSYGLLCIFLSFMAESLGPGVLQASLATFGIIGGPVLGVFTLGMVCPRANQTGALTGLISSLAFLFWIGFGRPKPPVQPLPVSVANCTYLVDDQAAHNSSSSSVLEGSVPDTEYFYLYKISYAWYALIGCCMSMLVGYLVSLPSKEDVDLDPDLFMDFVRCKMHKRNTNEIFSNGDTRKKTMERFQAKE